MHGITQGAIAGVSGGSFWQGFVAGPVSSTVSSIFMGVNHAANLSATAGDVSTMFFGSVSGGLSAELIGGNFWQGAAIGLTVSGLNHVAHSTIQRIKYNSFLSKVDEWISNQFLLISSEVVKIHNKISNLSK